ncbi:hypothetical protein OAT16_01790 [Prolixibacteraceae bacterium]|nr:hypothetical protein [Prolixibacteraceae bacterium]
MDKVFLPVKMPLAMQEFTEIRALENFPYQRMEDLMKHCHKFGDDKQKRLNDVHIYQHYQKENYVVVQSFADITYIIFLEQGKEGFLGTQDYILSEGTLLLRHSSRRAIPTNLERKIIRSFFEALEIRCSDAVLGIAMTDLRFKKKLIEPTAVFIDMFLEMYQCDESMNAALNHFKSHLFVDSIKRRLPLLKPHCIDNKIKTITEEDRRDYTAVLNKIQKQVCKMEEYASINIDANKKILKKICTSTPQIVSTADSALINTAYEIASLEPTYQNFIRILSIYDSLLAKFNHEAGTDNKEGYNIEDLIPSNLTLLKSVKDSHQRLSQVYQEMYDLLFSNCFFTVYHYEMEFKFNKHKHLFSLSTISLTLDSYIPFDERIRSNFILQRYNGKEWENMLCVIHDQIVFVNESHGLTRMDIKRIFGQLCAEIKSNDILRSGQGIELIEPSGELLNSYGMNASIFEVYPQEDNSNGYTIVSYIRYGEDRIDIYEKKNNKRTYQITLSYSGDKLVLKDYSSLFQGKEESAQNLFMSFEMLIDLIYKVKGYSHLLPNIMLSQKYCL